MFDSPIAFCPRCNQMVLLDQTQRECRAEHGCADIECPLLSYFSGYDFRQKADDDNKKGKEHHDAD